MNRRQALLAGAFLAAFTLAFFLRDLVGRAVLAPLAYLWWLLRLYYSAMPQLVLWVLLVAFVFISAVNALVPRVLKRKEPRPAPQSTQGQVEALAVWLKKSPRGSYYKWLVANRLGRIAREILAQRNGQPLAKKFGRLEDSDWMPPQKIGSYLESGLNGSFADFPRPRFWQTPQPTPLDMDPGQVIEYLENEIKTSR